MRNLFLLSILFVIGCSTANQSDGDYSVTLIDYRVEAENIVIDTIRDQWAKTNRESLKQIENPRPAFYSMKVDNSMSILSYEPSISNEQEQSHVEYTSFPFTPMDSYKFIDSTAVYINYSEENKGSFIKIDNLKANWVKGNKDSIILGTPVTLMTAQTKEFKIRAWVTNDFNSNLSIYDTYCPEGFVLAYEKESYVTPPFAVQKMKVYPIKMNKKSVKSFERPVISKTISLNEALENNRQ